MIRLFLFLAILVTSANIWSSTEKFIVTVESAGMPVTNALVMLWQAQPGKKPKLLAQSTTTKEGQSHFDELPVPNSGFYYLTTNGGQIDGSEVALYVGLAVLNADLFGRLLANLQMSKVSLALLTAF